MMVTVLLAALLPVIPQPRNADALGPEGYKITLVNGKATIVAESPVGYIWANQTINQLMRDERMRTATLEITDVPKYRVRGLLLDVGRKYIPMTYLYKLVDEMSYYKLNTLQLHLNDNEICKDPKADWSTKYAAFRLESSTYPELTAKDGSYTKAEFRNLMKYAKTKGVTIVPEIDVPAHSLAFTRIRPDFASKQYGEDHFDLSKQDEILQWLEPLFAEYLTGEDPVFAGPYCHVGTDEYNKAAAEDFRKFTDSMFKMVRKYGYKACAWGSLSHAKGETPVLADRDIYMDIWSNQFYRPEEAIAAGYSIISIPDGWVYIVPKAGYYYDYLNLPFLYNNWEPNVIGDKVLPEDCEQIVGGKYALWNDLLDAASLEDVEKRISHAMPVMAQKLWSGKVQGQTFEEFQLLSGKLR
jgi:hexosaminidase